MPELDYHRHAGPSAPQPLEAPESIGRWTEPVWELREDRAEFARGTDRFYTGEKSLRFFVREQRFGRRVRHAARYFHRETEGRRRAPVETLEHGRGRGSVVRAVDLDRIEHLGIKRDIVGLCEAVRIERAHPLAIRKAARADADHLVSYSSAFPRNSPALG